MIELEERKKMLAVHLCGERVLLRLESIGIERLADLCGRDPWQVMHEINVRAGRPIWHAPMAITALQNLIDAARQDRIPSAASR